MSTGRHQFEGYLKGLFAVVVWGASFIATKIALRYAPPMLIVWLRFGVGVGILGLFVAVRRDFALVSRRDLAGYALLGFLGIAFHQWLQSTGLLTAQATTTAWIVATTPIFIAILGRLFLQEHLGWTKVGGIFLATLGVLIVVSRGDVASVVRWRFGTHGDFLILLSAVNWAVFSILSRRMLKGSSPTNMMLYVMGLGWLFVTVFLAGEYSAIPEVSFPREGWIAVMFLGVFCSGFAYVFWYDALKALPATRLGSLLYLEPLVAVAVAGVFLGEPVVPAVLAGGGLILFGVWLVNRG